ncbi:beta strand repeat-containing protein [Paenibacillus kobensis]|uniref:beta strand repeat-containing protein n=1 Tax=Paenibacillus kobensis TaxID=59841 RepID=UPI000FD7798D|nr:carboxypeptidase regulatory-like domain-containing protein [Paenibacillus kobensis]
MPFPSLAQFVPVTLNGAPVTDPVRDVSPDETDIVGSAAYPAAYYAYDGTNVYFRIRLNADPRFKTGFNNFAWGVLFDTDGIPSTYEWVLAVNGNNNSVDLIVNTVKIPNSFNDQAEGTDGKGMPSFTQPIINYDIARAAPTGDGSSFGGGTNYFLDFFIPKATLFPLLGITDQSSLRFLFFTSTNNNNFNKDFIGSGQTLSAAFSDPLTVNGGDVRAKLSVTQTVDGAPLTLIAGQSSTVNGTITVTNSGRSSASAIFINALFQFNKLVSLQTVSATDGTAVINLAAATLTWNIGTLNAGSSAVLRYSAQGTFLQSAAATIDVKSAKAVDLFTGQPLTVPQSTAVASVVSVGGITGTVFDKSTGLPLTGVAVRSFSVPSGTSNGSAVSGTGGLYSIAGVPPGNVQLQFSLPNYQTATVNATVAFNAVATVNVLLLPQPASVQGTVTSQADASPIAGAAIHLTDSIGALLAQTSTNAAGQYAISGLLPNYYRISIAASGFQQQDLPLTLTSGETRVVNAALAGSPGAVAGTVTTAAGIPIAGAKAEALDNRNNVLATVLTNISGVFRADSLAPGLNDRLRVSVPGFVTQIIGFQVAAGQTTTVNVKLSAEAGSITGIITDAESGQGLPGTSIRAVNAEGITLQTAVSSADGSYSIPSLQPGSYSLSFSEEGYAAETVGAIVTSGASTTINIALETLAGALAGTVTDLAGVPLEDVVIRVYLNNIIIARVSSAEDGTYMIGNLAPGVYTISARTDGFGGDTFGVIIEPSLTTNADFRLVPDPGMIVGKITDIAGNPIVGAAVAVQNNVDGGPVLLTRILSETDGAYIIAGLAPGNYIVNVSAAAFQNQFASALVRSDAQTPLDFKLLPSPGTISGSVLDSSGNPLVGAGIQIRVTSANGITVFSLFTDPVGQFQSSSLTPGIYTVFASADSFQTASATVAVASGATEKLTLVLYPEPGSIQGTVVDLLTGAGLPGVVLNITDQNNFLVGITVTDSDGRFDATGIAPGNYTIVAQENGYQSNTFGVIVNANAITPASIPLSPNPGTINGTLRPPIGGAVVQLTNLNNVQVATTVTEPDGSFTFSTVQRGSYLLTAVAPGYSSGVIGATIVPGGVDDVVIDLTSNPGTVEGFVRDIAGQPLPQAAVKVVNGNESIRGIGQAQADGSYIIGNLPLGTLTVIASASGFSNEIKGVNLSPGELVSSFNYELAPNPGFVNGQITDGVTGQPIGGADVEIRILGASGLSVTSVSASMFGNYQISGLQPGPYLVVARADGYSTGTAGAIVISDQSTIASIALAPAFGSLIGTVTDLSGNPISSVNTQLRLFTQEGILINTFFAGVDGTFFGGDLPAGEFTLNVSSPGFEGETIGVFIKAGSSTAVAIRLAAPVAAVTGQVVDASTGAGISGAVINVTDVYGHPVSPSFSDENGNFGLSGIPAGNLIVTASTPGAGTDSGAIVTAPGQTTNVQLSLTPNPGNVFGFVSDSADGSDLSGATVRIYDGVTGALIATVITDNGGVYTYPNLPAGPYTASAAASGYASELGGFTIVSGATTRFSFTLDKLPGRISGRVTADPGGTAIQGATLVLRQYNNFGPVISSILTDSDGNYDLGEVAAANYIVTASQSGFVTIQTSASVLPGQNAAVNFSLAPAPLSVSGKVTDVGTGASLPDSSIVIIDDNGVIVGNGVTDKSGQYTVPSVPAGNLTVIASDPGYQSGTGYVIQPVQQVPPTRNQTADLSLNNGPAAIEGTVVDDTVGSPVSGAIVTVLEPVNNVPLGTTVTDGTGSYQIGGLVPGAPYTVTVSSPDFGSVALGARAGAAAGTIGKADLALRSAFGTLTGTIRDAKGNPLNYALAEVTTDEQLLVRNMISNTTGRYTITNVAAGGPPSRFSFPGKQTAIARPVIVNGQTTVLDIILYDEEEE